MSQFECFSPIKGCLSDLPERGLHSVPAFDHAVNPLAPNEIHVWRVDLLNSSYIASEIGEVLHESERDRAASFLCREDELSSIVRWSVLRLLLGGYLKTAPKAVAIKRTAKGKPFIHSRDAINFNISSSAGVALYAFARTLELGVDVERIRGIPNYLDIVERFFALPEKEYFERLDEDSRLSEFFRFWVRKEALLKAWGEGLHQPLNRFVLDQSSDLRVRVSGPSDDATASADWWVTDFFLEPDFPAAVAATAAPMALHQFVWHWR